MKAPHPTENEHQPGLRLSSTQDRSHHPFVRQPGSRPVCDLCQTDDYLVYEHVRVLAGPDPAAPPVWEVDCWCGRCETFYGYPTTQPPKDPAAVRTALKVGRHSAGVDPSGPY